MIDTLNIGKLVGPIQTYELTLKPSKKNKDMAFKSFKNVPFNNNDGSDAESIVKFAHRFKKYLKTMNQQYNSPNRG